MRARMELAALLLVGVVVGAASLAIARDEPGYSFSGLSPWYGVAEGVAGFATMAIGIIARWRRPSSRFGVLLAASGSAWFLVEWNNPGAGSAFVFTVGLLLYVAAPPLVAHAMLGYPDRRVHFWLNRIGLALAYCGAIFVLGVLPTLVFDPAAEGCAQCPRNMLLVHGSPGAYESINRIGVHLGLAWALLLMLLAGASLMRMTPARRWLAVPVVIAGCAYLGLVAADFAYSLERGFLSNGIVDRRLWLGEAAALCALALGVTWGWLRARRTRSKVVRLVVELAKAPPPGGLRDVLAATLGDPSLQLAYPLSGGRFVDAHGQALQLEGEATPLVRGGQEVAFLSHRPGLLDDPEIAAEVASAARLVLTNERLQAEARAQLDDLRTSRTRIIETGDAERRWLERNLHDGAQQRLVGLSLSLRLARSNLGSDLDSALLARVEEAEGELRAALAELRELAHGIFPAVLADEGLSAALEALAEEAPIEITALPGERLDAAAETAGYFVVSEALRRSAAGVLKVGASRRDGLLVIEVEGDGAPDEIVDLEDRVGALDGTLEVVRNASGRVTIRAEIPCES